MELKILPPKGCEPKDIKHDLKELESGYVDIATYPNGVEIVITHINGHADIASSKPLIKIDDCTWKVPD